MFVRVKTIFSACLLFLFFFLVGVGDTMAAAPANDNFADAAVISGASGSTTADLTEATSEANEPDHAGSSAYQSVWFKWTAPASPMHVMFRVERDAGISVYTGNALSALSRVTDSLDQWVYAVAAFSPVANTTYYIAVDGPGYVGAITLSWEKADKITGTISLPGGMTAPTGGLSFSVHADTTDDSSSVFADVVIPSSQSAVAYTLYVSSDQSFSWRVYYRCYDCGAPLLAQGYYAGGTPPSTTGDVDQAALLSGGQDHANIDLQMLTGKTISGTISLPDPVPAGSGSVHISISANRTNGSGYGDASVTIPEGSTSAVYAMGVPDIPGSQWRVDYWCYGCEPPLLEQGYYAGGTPPSTTWDMNQAALLSGGQDHANIDLQVLTGKTISGTISLADSVPAGFGDNYEIIAEQINGDYLVSTDYFILAASWPSSTYVLAVPDAAGMTWRVRYLCLPFFGPCDSRAVEEGYYASDKPNTTTPNIGEATPVDATVEPTDIDMTVLMRKPPDDTFCFPIKTRSGKVAVVCL